MKYIPLLFVCLPALAAPTITKLDTYPNTNQLGHTQYGSACTLTSPSPYATGSWSYPICAYAITITFSTTPGFRYNIRLKTDALNNNFSTYTNGISYGYGQCWSYITTNIIATSNSITITTGIPSYANTRGQGFFMVAESP